MDEETVEKYVKAGKILKKVQENARKSIKPGQKMLEIAEKIEKEIVGEGGQAAFPVNLSRNNFAAHFTPSTSDEAVVGEKDVLKVDIGVHIDGFIADSAFTLDFSGENGKLLEASEKALQNALSMVKEGQEIGKIGAEIEKTIKSYGFNPIQNLSGHGLGQWVQHGAPTIPNIAKNDKRKLEDGIAFAIEPFATDGLGFVKEGVQAEIFQLDEPKPTRNKDSRKIIEFVDENYKSLPFAERWIAKELKLSDFARKIALRELLKNKGISAFPILHEENGKLVSQAETSIILNNGSVIILV
ncbi:MAG: type II methionyl aminopeptidase [Candidatus Diapherotrites archaeon]